VRVTLLPRPRTSFRTSCRNSLFAPICFAAKRCRDLRWVFEAKKLFGVSVLDYRVTSNHIHLLVKDTGPNVIAQSMQLIAGRTAQEYNQRKGRQGAFWEDRYHLKAGKYDFVGERCWSW
jgi:putative transposase